MALALSVAPPPAPTIPPETTPEIEELYSAWALTILCFLLILSLWASYYVQVKRIRAIHETVLSIFAGMVVGLIVRLSPGHLIREMLTFKHTLFFNLLLPPIILNSGYELKQENFFRNFGSILTFAFIGTFISAVGIGVLTYIYSFLSLESLNVTLIECLIFGSTLSATDPVTILAIFNQYKVDPKLYSVIFGESILNDAVSIVMYETLSQFHGSEIYVSSIFNGIGIFLFSFISSMALGVLSENFIFIYLGLNLFTQDVQVFKPLFILVATVIVCATRYAAVFPLSELINLFHRTARGKRGEEIPHSYQMMLFWAGLRGAVGVALAAGFMGDNAPALRTTVLVVVVLTVIMFGGTTARMLEVLGIRTGVEDGGDGDSSEEERYPMNVSGNGDWSGGPTPGAGRDRRFRRSPTGWNSPNAQAANRDSRRGSRSNTLWSAGSDDSDAGEVLPPGPNMQADRLSELRQLAELGADGKWFTALDERYLLPLFSNSVASRKFHARKARRAASNASQDGDNGSESDDERDRENDSLMGSRSPRARPGDFRSSIGEFWKSVKGSASGANSPSVPGTPTLESMRMGFRPGPGGPSGEPSGSNGGAGPSR
ncbi:monovalent cation:H+ antiporter, CPA1 (nhx1) [Tulasnella sp. UAMH 9824]|nr:monovalent cation:H+ antiporter, CPA1 (nhx1) [Tulasnella sp. UAMH 9824]